MKIIYDNLNENSGLGNYSRAFVNEMAKLFPKNQFNFIDKNTDLENVSIFHSFNAEIPKSILKSNVLKIITIDGTHLKTLPWWKKWFSKNSDLKSIHNADIIIVPTHKIKKDCISFFKIPEDKVKVIFPFNDLTFNTGFSEDFLFEIRHRFQLPKRFILSVNRRESSNVLSILQSIKDTEIPLVIVNKNPNIKKIKNFVKRNKMKNQVTILENISKEDLSYLYQLADIFVYPTLDTNDGIDIIRALFSKTIVITSNQYLAELAGENSVYIYPNMVEDIKAKILFLWNNEAERNRRIEKSTTHLPKFHLETIAKQVMDIYLTIK